MDDKDNTGPVSTNARLRELDDAHWNMLRVILVIKHERSLTMYMRTRRQTWCPKCQVVHDEGYSFYINYN